MVPCWCGRRGGADAAPHVGRAWRQLGEGAGRGPPGEEAFQGSAAGGQGHGKVTALGDAMHGGVQTGQRAAVGGGSHLAVLGTWAGLCQQVGVPFCPVPPARLVPAGCTDACCSEKLGAREENRQEREF